MALLVTINNGMYIKNNEIKGRLSIGKIGYYVQTKDLFLCICG